MNLMPPLGDKTKGLVKGGYMLYAGRGNLQPLGHSFQGLSGQPIVLHLNVQQRLNEITGVRAVLINDLIDSFQFHGTIPV
jgi:hypothetical protein